MRTIALLVPLRAAGFGLLAAMLWRLFVRMQSKRAMLLFCFSLVSLEFGVANLCLAQGMSGREAQWKEGFWLRCVYARSIAMLNECLFALLL